MRIDGKIKSKMTKTLKEQSQLFRLPPKCVGHGVLSSEIYSIYIETCIMCRIYSIQGQSIIAFQCFPLLCPKTEGDGLLEITATSIPSKVTIRRGQALLEPHKIFSQIQLLIILSAKCCPSKVSRIYPHQVV